MQGLSLVLDTRLRFAKALTSIEERGLQTNVITTPLKGLLPDYRDGADVFSGQVRQLRGLTLSPLQGITGAPTGFVLSLEYSSLKNMTLLTYSERGHDSVQVAQWPGNEGAFSYRGRSGDWRDQWPPRGDEYIQAPRTIRIETGLDQSILFVQVMGPLQRPMRVQDTPLGSPQ